jgi:hypothetical protein
MCNEYAIIVAKTSMGAGKFTARWVDNESVVQCRSLLRDTAEEAFLEVLEVMDRRAAISH